jgi:glycosyltransferase involved in cell wall biosynthesis
VLADIPTLREVWGNSALFVNPLAPSDIGRTINRLIRDPALCAKYATRAQQRAKRYSRERMSMAYLDLYQELFQGHVLKPPPLREPGLEERP